MDFAYMWILEIQLDWKKKELMGNGGKWIDEKRREIGGWERIGKKELVTIIN
jgi:hypothetical protein